MFRRPYAFARGRAVLQWGRLFVPVLATSLAALSTAVPVRADGEGNAVSFNFEVRPILSDNCLRCHGPDAKQRKAELRLDDRDSALKKGAIKPGDPDGSELIKRLHATDPDDVMPPPDMHRTITAEQENILRKWIAEGATYQKHWAFLTPEKPAVPQPPADATIRNEIDAFVQSRLAAKGWKPAPEASKEEWLRRVTFALTGLPPKLEEIDAFLADTTPQAYEKVVDRLLASPSYGERMAVDWLDAARFADTYGRHEDADCDTWPWRDWVIRMFNQNIPYNTFVKWQIAGDLMPQDGQDALVATCFNRLHQQSNESGSNEDEFRWEHVFDRVRTMGTAILGLTLECSRCHDHKYDPITMRDYYSMAGFFNNIDELGLFSRFTNGVPAPSAYVYKDDESERHEKWRSMIAAADERCGKEREEARGRFKTWLASNAPPGLKRPPSGFFEKLFGSGDNRKEASVEAKPISHYTFDDGDKASKSVRDSLNPKGKATTRTGFALTDGKHGKAIHFREERDNQIMFDDLGHFRRVDPFTIGLWVKAPAVPEHAVILHHSRAGLDAANRGYEVTLENGRLAFTMAHFYPGNGMRIQAKDAVTFTSWTHLAVSYDGSSKAAGMAIYVNGRKLATEVVRDNLYKDIEYLAKWGDLDNVKVADAEMKNAASLEIGGRYLDKTFTGAAVDDLFVYDVQLSAPEVAKLAEAAPEGGEDAWFDWYLREVDDEYRKAAKRLVEARRGENALTGDLQELMVMRDRTGAHRPTPMLKRGQWDQPGDLVEPAAPAIVFPWANEAPKNRLGFAEWLTDPRHPLTARVAVNRYWRLLTGRGFVATPEDFGNQGALPTDPALYDWMTTWFTENGWDIKKLAKLIVLSHTYRQSGVPADSRYAKEDPENTSLCHGPRFRLPAEQVRDAVLSVSGLLVPKIGGPSVKPYQPAGLWEDSGTQHVYEQEKGDALHRRSLYTFWRRTCPPPVMSLFDAPTREFCRVRRDETLTPLQGLALLNDTGFVEAARVLAEKLVREAPSDDASRVRTAFRLLTGKTPTEKQQTALTSIISEARQHYTAQDFDARKLLATTGEASRDESLSRSEVAATLLMTRALFASDEFVCSY